MNTMTIKDFKDFLEQNHISDDAKLYIDTDNEILVGINGFMWDMEMITILIDNPVYFE